MKITYLHQYFNTPAQAGGTRSYEFARRLAAHGHQVNLLTTIRNPAQDEAAQDGRWRTEQVAGFDVHMIPVPYANRMGFRERMQAFLRFALRSAQRAAELPADVIFATSTPLTIALPAVFASKVRRVPMVFEVRDLWPELPIAFGVLRHKPLIAAARWLERFAYANATAIIVLSPGMKAGVIEAGYPAERVHVIPNSSDVGLFQAPPESGRAFRERHEWLGDRPLVLYAGSLGHHTGVEYLARVAGEAARVDPEIRFLVAGEGAMLKSIADLAEELGVLNRTFFMLPPQPKSEMPALFSAATIALSLTMDLPIMWHNSANKFFDALAAGRPVAINYGGWQADLLRESGAGLQLPAGDPRAAAALLAQVLASPAYLEQAGAAALDLAKSRFDRDTLAAQFEQVLRDAVSDYAAGRGRPS